MALLVIRAFGPRGRYPLFTLQTPHHWFVPGPDLVYGAVVENSIATTSELPELASYTPEEIRLYAAVTLVGRRFENEGWIILDPSSVGEPIHIPAGTDLDALETRQLVFDHLPGIVDRATQYSAQPTAAEPLNLCPVGDPLRCTRLIDSIEPSDDLCLRGLSKLLTATALTRHFAFMEEAALAAYISLEAALCMLRRQLGNGDIDRVSYADRFTYLRESFPYGSPLVQFLHELYQVRTTITHPVSRHGIHWSPPMYADDCYEAVEWLVEFYRFLLLGEIRDDSAA